MSSYRLKKRNGLFHQFNLPVTLSSFFIWWSPYLVLTLFGDGADETPSLGASVSSSTPRTLFPAPFTSAGLEDEGVGATECAAVGVLTPLALFEPFLRVGGIGFPLGDLGARGDGDVLTGIVACRVAVGIGGSVRVACDRDGLFICAGCKGGGCRGHDIAAGAGGAVGGTGGENSASLSASVIAEGSCGAGCGVEGAPLRGIMRACVLWRTTFKPLSILSASCLIL